MTQITHDRQITESMLFSVRADAGDPLDPPSPALLSAQRAYIAALEAALASDKPSEHEAACQAAWAASLALRDDESMTRWGVPSGERAASIRKAFSDAAQKAVAAVDHVTAATSVYGLAERTPAWAEAADEWIAFVRRETPGPGDHAVDRFVACRNGFRLIAAAWQGGTTAMLRRIDPTRREVRRRCRAR